MYDSTNCLDAACVNIIVIDQPPVINVLETICVEDSSTYSVVFETDFAAFSIANGMTFIGNGPDVLKRVTAVGHDLALDRGVGVCSKDGQSVPVGVGLPTIRINGLTVGGVAT